MLGADPRISSSAVISARIMQAAFPLAFRLQSSSPEVQFATHPISKPTVLHIPTRHGQVKAYVYAPHPDTVTLEKASGLLPPVHVALHGGAFIVRRPLQEDNVARYLASEVGTYVVLPDYDTAPTVMFPVSEEQSYDVFNWVHEHASEHGWDGERMTVGGPSSGSKMAFSVVTQAIDAGTFVPLALSSEYGVADLSRPNSRRQSPKAKPVVPEQMMDLVKNTYFADAVLTNPLASPTYYERLSEFPPTLIMTGELDTLKHEMNELADIMTLAGVEVTHHEFPGADHGFTHSKPASTAYEALVMIGNLLQFAYTRAPRL